MQDSTRRNPFDTTDLLSLPPLHDDVSSAWSGFRLEVKLENTLFHLPQTKNKELPLLQPGNFHLVHDEASLESLDSSSTSAYDTAEDDADNKDGGSTSQHHDDIQDIWVLSDVKDAPRVNKLTSWDHFLREEPYEPPSRYLAEAGTTTFDAVLALERADGPPKIAPNSAYLDALSDLAMGRASQYWTWDEQYSEFVPNTTSLTMSGYSPELIDEVRDAAASMGSRLRLFSKAASGHLTNKRANPPSLLAFDATQDSIIAAVHRCMVRKRHQVQTLPQLQELLEGPRHLLVVVEQFSQIARRNNNDQTLLLACIRAAETTSMTHPQCHSLVNLLLTAVAGPLLARLASELGLQAVQASFTESVWDTICSADLAKLITETQNSLRLLRENSMTTAKGLSMNKATAPELAIYFTWKGLMTSYAAAQSYEVAAKPTPSAEAQAGDLQALRLDHPQEKTSSKSNSDPMVFQPLDFDSLSSRLVYTDASIDALVYECFSQEQHEETDMPIPYDQAVALSLTPIVTAQHRVLSYSALELLYRTCDLRLHLNLLRQFQLFGDGLFAARVSIALFDSEQSSGEGRRQDGHATGLRVQNRDSWPPASSELRLVLMGILSEHLPTNTANELESAISFSLRDLPEADLERCRDVDSIYALDFLRMQYKPPNTLLEAVISQESLDGYDRIFKHLLRVLRLQSVAQTLLREVSARNAVRVEPHEHRFRIELHHFVSVLADYSQNVAITQTWIPFHTMHGELEQKIEEKDYEGTLRLGKCLEHLKQQHEQTLDAVLRVLLLKEKQSKARSLVEDLFGIILRFAAVLRARNGADEEDTTAETTRRLYEDFKKKLNRLKDALRGGGGIVDQLLLRLDMRVRA